MVRGTFSPARAWRPAAGARLARTLGRINATIMLFIKKACPSCGAKHGQTIWRVSNSSRHSPVRCHSCGENFFQSGQSLHFIVVLLGPVGFTLFSGVSWVPAIIFVAFASVAMVVYINRYKSLISGPKYG